MKKRIKYYIQGISCCLFLVAFLSCSLVAHAEEDVDQNLKFNSVVEIERYEVEGGHIEAGKETNITLTLHNANKRSQANSLAVIITSDSGMVYPSYGNDNQFFVGTLEAGESTDLIIPVVINSKLTGDYVDLICELVYECGGNIIRNTSTIVMPTQNNSSLVVNSLSVSAHATVNGKSLLSVNYTNSGIDSIKDAAIEISGNVSDSTQLIDLGTIAAGKSDIKDCNIIFVQPGEQDIVIKLKYTDVNGTYRETDLGTYRVNVTEELESVAESNEENSSLVLAGRIIALVASIFATITVFVYLKKR